jgi:DNA-binding GntR family transcriptional regulator
MVQTDVLADPTSADGRPLSLADRAYLALRDRLITLHIRPGEPIDDLQVAGELQVGRTPVREALKRLEDDHLVIAYPRRGTFATGVDITDLAHINELRLALEPLAAARAATQATMLQRSAMRDLLDQLAALDTLPSDRTELMRLDLLVHRTMYRASGNPHLEDVLVRYHNLATRIFCLFLERLADVSDHINEHVALLTAIVDGDADRAADLARDHVLGFEAAVRAVI